MRTKTILPLMMVAVLALSACTSVRQPVKSISVLGDSYSTFTGWMTPDTNELWYFANGRPDGQTDVKNVEETWWHLLLQKGPFKLERNNSYSGSTIGYLGYFGADYKKRSFITRADNLGNPDIILVFGGTNDDWVPAPMGDYVWENPTEEQLYTFRPAMAYMLQRLRTLYPKADVRFILNTNMKDEIVESIHTICHHYSVPVIVLHDIKKLSGHPSVEGMQAVADQVYEALK